MKKKISRVKYGKEPVLHVHRWIVSVGKPLVSGQWHTRFHHCLNLDEVQLVKKRAPKGSFIEVYEAHHNFREAFQVE